MTTRDAPILWQPASERAATCALATWSRALATAGLVPSGSYDDVLRWSVREPGAFWRAWARHIGLDVDDCPTVLASEAMPGASWFPGVTLNYVDVALAERGPGDALVFDGEDGTGTISRAELHALVRRAAAGLRALGVRSGDRVAAYVSNRWEAVVGFLAAASLGAVWSSCASEFGAKSVIDRLGQARPAVLIATTGYRFGGRWHDRTEIVHQLRRELPGLEVIVLLDDARLAGDDGARQVTWSELLDLGDQPLTPVQVPFDHPLWVVFTSGTTGLPKSIVHSHGGIVVEHSKLLTLHLDVAPGERFAWFTTTGWVMWNILIGALLTGAVPVLIDGSPVTPSPERLWQVAADSGASTLGLSAGFIHQAMRGGHEPHRDRDLGRLRTIGITGSPLSPAGYEWIYDRVGADTFLASVSGGTDVATAFLGSVPTLPVRAGQLQHACLGVAADCWGPDGRPLIGEVGELVVTQPMPSMPLSLWGDADGRRYRSSYFETYPGVWRHGDWVIRTPEDQWVVLGRSDATLNRGGVRMGSAEFYGVLDELSWIIDSLVIDASTDASTGSLLLLVQLANGESIGARRDELETALRTQLSPRHVPDHILVVEQLPHTLNGKRLEVPVKRLFLGADVDEVVDPSAVDDPDALHVVAAAAAAWRGRRPSVSGSKQLDARGRRAPPGRRPAASAEAGASGAASSDRRSPSLRRPSALVGRHVRRPHVSALPTLGEAIYI